MPAVLRHTDEPEMTAVFAPKPALYISVTGDWTASFPNDEYPHIRTIYHGLGAAERVESRHFDSPHDYSKPMREAMVAWFDRWLRGSEGPPPAEPGIATESPESLAAMDQPPADNRGTGGIVEYFSRRTTFQKPQPQTAGDWTDCRRNFQDQFANLLGEREVQDAPLEVVTIATDDWNGHRLEKLTYTSELEFTVPALLLRPQTLGQSPCVIVLAPGGKAEVVTQRAAWLRELVDRGFVVFIPDVRLRGELGIKWDLNSVIWGRPELGMAVHDIRRAVDCLQQRPDVAGRRIYCIGLGEMGVAALSAAALDDRIAAVAATELGKTIRSGRGRPIVPHILRHGDLPQIAALVTPRPVWLNHAEPAEEFEFARRSYAASNSTAIVLRNLPPQEAERDVVQWLRSVKE